MTAKTKGEWPYHKDPHGNWVACSNNPCKLHSGGDIMATSPEDAFAKADRMTHPQGGEGLTGADATKHVDKGAEEVRKVVEDRHNRQARVMEKMAGVYKPPVADPPADLKKAWDIELHLGGKYLETQRLPRGKVATLMRHDITQLKKAGGVPKGWKIKTKVDNDPYHSDFYITVTRPAGTAPAYRRIRPTDVYDPDNKGEGRMDYQEELKKEVGTGDYTYDQAVEYCKRHPEHRQYSDEFKDTEKYLQDIADQYYMHGTSAHSRLEDHRTTILYYPIDEEETGKSGN